MYKASREQLAVHYRFVDWTAVSDLGQGTRGVSHGPQTSGIPISLTNYSQTDKTRPILRARQHLARRRIQCGVELQLNILQ